MEVVTTRKNKKRVLPAILWFLSVTIAAAVLYVFWIGGGSGIISTKSSSSSKAAEPVTISSNVLFLGNTFWGRYIDDWSMASSLKYQYPFSRLNEFNRDQYDAWISGLECPTAAGITMTSAQMDETLEFNCSPEYLSEATKWFTAFTLANNHTDNQQISGFEQTQEALDTNGIQYFGHYDPRALNDICDVISLPVMVTNNDKSLFRGNLPVAMCGYHGVFRIPTADSVAVMQRYASYMPVIAMPHMGAEYKTEPDQIKTDFYRSLIDGGADMVIGDHPHFIQTTESYKGRLIVYSMGNFMFDQQFSDEVTRSAGIRVVVESNDATVTDLNKWLSIGDSCSTYHDDCLNQIINAGLTKLNLTYRFAVVGTNDSDHIVKPATAAQQTSILTRLKWQTTMSQLQAPYSSL